jgi:hypothetical protein
MAQAVSHGTFRTEVVVRSHVKLVVDKLALRQFFLLALWVCSVSIIPPTFHFYIYTLPLSSGKRDKPGKLSKSNALLEIGEHWIPFSKD